MSLFVMDRGTYLSIDLGQGQVTLDMTCVEEDLDARPRTEWVPWYSDLPLKCPVHELNLIEPKPCSQSRLSCTQNTAKAVNRWVHEAGNQMKADYHKVLSFRVVC